MRLIDADELETKLMKAADKFSRKKPRTTLIILFAVDILRCAETVKATPMRHSKWIKTRNDKFCDRDEEYYCYDCTVCGYHTGDQGSEFNYCPNCGAKMDEKQ